jgi:hypothetical protein
MDNKLKALEQEISSITSRKEQIDILLAAFDEHMNTVSNPLAQPLWHLGNKSVDNPPAQPVNMEDVEYVRGLIKIAQNLGIADEWGKQMNSRKLSRLQTWENSWATPLKFLPCAHVIANDRYKCPNAGSKACSGCRLVSYCSTVCSFPPSVTQ